MDSQATSSGKKDNTYKMRTRIEVGERGILTHIVNIVELTEALGRPAAYVAMYMAYVLEVLPVYDYATRTFKLQGYHEAVKFSRIVDEFIERFIECYRCEYLKTRLVITKSMKIHLECDRCGFISEVDMKEGLEEFIIRSKELERISGRRDLTHPT